MWHGMRAYSATPLPEMLPLHTRDPWHVWYNSYRDRNVCFQSVLWKIRGSVVDYLCSLILLVFGSLHWSAVRKSCQHSSKKVFSKFCETRAFLADKPFVINSFCVSPLGETRVRQRWDKPNKAISKKQLAASGRDSFCNSWPRFFNSAKIGARRLKSCSVNRLPAPLVTGATWRSRRGTFEL